MEQQRSCKLLIILLIIIFKSSVCVEDLSRYKRLHFMSLASQYGLDCEEHVVVTDDGYIITIFRVPGDPRRPVLLMHGLLDSSDSFILRGNNSMVLTLAREGYDVWLGNVRGNRYARNHVTLDPDNDREFWDFSFHEIGIHDLPATIDHILHETGQTKLSCIGHSQGTTIFFALGSLKVEYNDKINVLIAMAPVAYLHYVPKPTIYIGESWPLINGVLEQVGQDEVFRDNSIERNLIKSTCSKLEGYNMCANGIFFALAGSDPEELEAEFFPTMLDHFPSGTSRVTGVHLSQITLTKKFSQRDFGVTGNLAAYNSTFAPEYDLSKVTMKIALLAATNDYMSPLKCVRLLKKQLANVVEYHIMSRRTSNHINYVWGRNMDKYLFPKVLSLLKQFSGT